MRRFLPILLATVACFPAGGAAPSPSASPTLTPTTGQVCPQPASACITGRVIDTTGAPKGGVCVQVGPAPGCTFVTGADGVFKVNLTKDAAVTWTLYLLVDGAIKGQQSVTGPFLVGTFSVGDVAVGL